MIKHNITQKYNKGCTKAEQLNKYWITFVHQIELVELWPQIGNPARLQERRKNYTNVARKRNKDCTKTQQLNKH